MKLKKSNIDKYAARFARRVRKASPLAITEGLDWYETAADTCQLLAERHGCTFVQACSVVAALSPRARWAHNLRMARDFLATGQARTMGSRIEAARRALDEGLDSFNPQTSPKVLEFARAIAGYPGAIVVDVWICRAAGLDKDSPTKRQRLEIQAAFRRVSRQFGLTPRETQAIVWVVERGKAQ